jgi:hypothetical protein
MKKKLLLFLKTPNLKLRKEAFSFLRKNQISVLAQYSNIAFEVTLTDDKMNLVIDSGFFAKIYDGNISNEDITDMPAEAKEIAAAWNLSYISLLNQAKEALPNRGLSWGTEGFDEPRPHSELSEDFFLKTLRERGMNQIESATLPDIRFSRERTINSFSTIERRLKERGIDETKVYHLSRLALVQPKLEEAIINLPQNVIDNLFKVDMTERVNLGIAMAGPEEGPEESCWRMNGEIAVGVVFVESAISGGPTFMSWERTTLRNEIQTGLNWLASQHPTGNLSWVYDYQYVSINVGNGLDSWTEDYWRNPAMQAVSYIGHSYSGDWIGVALYRNDMRSTNNSAHAIVIFVTPFATYWHAYAGNSRLTLCNRNNWGGWTIFNIDTITAHEVCHLFGAADEYTGSGTPCTSCTTTHGCDNAPNGNCKACASPGVPCVMDQNALQICDFTQRQIGWDYPHGRISLWKVDDEGNQLSFKEHGPFPGWTPLNCANNNILWRYVDGRISFWVFDDEGNQLSFKEHGPFPGWTPLNYADGRILWQDEANSISLWKIDAVGNLLNFKEHGPFPGWTPVNCANNNVLWHHIDGRISFWVFDDEGNQLSFKEHGPFPGWTPLNYADGRILWHALG